MKANLLVVRAVIVQETGPGPNAWQIRKYPKLILPEPVSSTHVFFMNGVYQD
jgi:hypothetical protein